MPVSIKKGSLEGKLDMTPMIDVVFQLIIFFMVATRFEEEERSMDVKLPSASEAMPLTVKPKELFINVNQAGEFYVSAQLMQADELLDVLQRAWASNPGRQTVIIRADRRCPFQFVATAMDMCNKANIRDYRVATAEEGG